MGTMADCQVAAFDFEPKNLLPFADREVHTHWVRAAVPL
jgi:hypothetical protein